MNDQDKNIDSNEPVAPPVVTPDHLLQANVPPEAPFVPHTEAPVVPVASKTPPLRENPVTLIKGKLSNLSKKTKILIGAMSFLFVILIVLSLVAPMIRRNGGIVLLPTPVPTISPVGEVFVPSPYANDPDIIVIEESIKAFETKLNETKLREDTLSVPRLDWKVDFKAQ